MIMSLRHRLPAAAALAILALTGTSALAQTAPPQSPDASRQGVRDILNRAETEGARRNIGDILGGIAGVSRAQAQTAPAQAPAPQIEAAPATVPTAPVTVAQSAPAAQAPAGPAAAPAAPVAPQAGRGTPADPSMIVRLPPSSAPATDAAPVPAPTVAVQGAAEATSAPVPAAVAAPAAVRAPGAPVVVAETSRPGVIVRRFGHTPVRAWCPPYRW